jgi:MFS transporter, DHA1 family, tetracycline resistance protein
MLKNKKIWLLLLIVFLDAIGLTIVIPLFPFLLGQYVLVKNVAFYLGMLVSIYAVCQFFSAPIMGTFSDYFGRKPILFYSLLGTAVGYFILGFGGALWLIFIGRIIDGLTAGDMSAVYAYVADSTKDEDRIKFYGYLGSANGVGFIIGPAIGGLLGIKYISLPFYVAGGISIITASLVYFYLPETLEKEKRTKSITFKSFNIPHYLKDVFALKEAKKILILGAFFFFGIICFQSNITVFLKDVFIWNSAYIGALLVVIGLCDIVARTILLPRVLMLFKHKVGIIGLALMLIGFLCLIISAYTKVTALLWIAIILIIIGEGLFDPAYYNMLSQSVNENKQGQLQGVNQSLQSLYEIFAPLTAGLIYLYSPTAVYVVPALLMFIALIYFSRIRKS